MLIIPLILVWLRLAWPILIVFAPHHALMVLIPTGKAH
jgi:hypothetical protein